MIKCFFSPTVKANVFTAVLLILITTGMTEKRRAVLFLVQQFLSIVMLTPVSCHFLAMMLGLWEYVKGDTYELTQSS